MRSPCATGQGVVARMSHPFRKPDMNHWTTLIKRLLGHLRQVLSEFVYAVLRLHVRWPTAMRFFVMRLLSPFGVGRAWDRPGRTPQGTVLDALRNEGFAELKPLAATDVAALRSFFSARSGAALGQRFADLSEYFAHMRQQNVQRPPGVAATGQADCAITQILFRNELIQLATAFLGIDRSRLVVSANMDALIRLDQPKARPGGYDDALELHRDIDNYRFFKIFVYLTDCALNAGHHQVYLQSHRHTPFALGPIARYSHQEVEQAIPSARLKNVEGKAGYAFAENTYAFHRGTPPLTDDRLILNLQYMEDNFLDYYPTAFRVPA